MPTKRPKNKPNPLPSESTSALKSGSRSAARSVRQTEEEADAFIDGFAARADELTADFQREEDLRVLWEKPPPTIAMPSDGELAQFRETSRAGKAAMATEVVDEQLRLLRKLRDFERSPTGRVQWKKFLNRRPAVSRQNLRELHHAEEVLGEKVLREALINLGHAKAVHLSRIPGIKPGTATRLLAVGIDLYDNGSLRPLTAVRDVDLRAYVRRKSRKTKKPYARRKCGWPDALLSQVKELVLAWPHVRAQARRKSTAKAAKTASRTLVLRVLTARLTLAEAIAELDLWLAACGHLGSEDGVPRRMGSDAGRKRT